MLPRIPTNCFVFRHIRKRKLDQKSDILNALLDQKLVEDNFWRKITNFQSPAYALCLLDNATTSIESNFRLAAIISLARLTACKCAKFCENVKIVRNFKKIWI